MSIGSNNFFSKSLISLAKNTQKLNSISVKLSTGKRINTGSDSPTALTSINKLNSQIRALNQVDNTITYGNSALSIADGTYSNLSNALGELRELAVQGSSDFLSASERNALQTRADSIVGYINDTANGANFNGTNLLDGTFSNKEFQIGPNEGDTLAISLGDARSTTLGIDTLDLSSSASSGNAITSLDSAITEITSQRADAGAQMRRLNNVDAINQTSIENLSAAKSQIEDLDFGQAVAELYAAQIQQSANMLVLSESLATEKTKLSLLV